MIKVTTFFLLPYIFIDKILLANYFSSPFSIENSTAPFVCRFPLYVLVALSSAIIVSYDQVLSNSQNNSLIRFNYFLPLSSLINIASNFSAETYTCFLFNNFYTVPNIARPSIIQYC